MNKKVLVSLSFIALLALILVFVFTNNRNKKIISPTDANRAAPAQTFWVGDTTEYVHGIDVSHFQDSINWSHVKNYGVTFVFVKATEGVDYLDTMFHYNWKNVKDENMIRGAYHFYESDDDPVVQAKWFVNNVESFEGTLPPVIDVERAGHDKVTLQEYQNRLIILLKEVERLTGRQPILYSSPGFAAEHLSDELFSDYKLWIAEYDVPQPTIPGPWQTKGWNFWQNTSQDKVPGVPKLVDRNRYIGRYSDLVKMVGD